ncbi:unnamed protein product [Bursaphelenchus okinawaensis]|uniref:RRM domain-containing protein n=1 Tax=Bursaphelenchus okinawaensis TaxID=465554 RepID=A0A811KVV2_9BILA|nr:unnamed protein product [Bursaphelenchus okinawaensis]CAG9112267.1 unnamed protein product [Bursaphelenchus okinawaensis]
MSRVVIKNLPSKCTEDTVRKFFKDYDPITDVSFKYTKDGVFRKFAFVGFDCDEKAQEVIKKYNQSFFGSSRIVVEECAPIDERNRIRPWSKHSKGSTAYKRIHGDDDVLENVNGKKFKSNKGISFKYENDPLFAEFLKVRGVKLDKKEETEEENSEEFLLNAIETYKGDKSVSLIFRGLPTSIKQTNLKEWLSPIRIKSCFFVNAGSEAFGFVQFNRPGDAKKALQRTNQFLGGFKVRICKFPEDAKPKEHNDEEMEDIDFEAERKKITDKILDTGRLFLRNLPYVCTGDDLTFLFKKYGELIDVQCVVNRQTGQCKGFAVITFMFPENALTAYTELDGTVFKGRMLHILPGEEKLEESGDQGGEKVLSKFQKEKNQKKEAAGKAFSWNTLFLGANAVADTLAEKLAIQKSDFLEGDDKNSAAVRMSLAETRLVNETRDFLIKNGVCLDAFSRPVTKRSDSVMIVKNLSAATDSEELKRMFERFGEIKRFLLPPECKVTGLVEFKLAVDAKKAFKGLAYSKYRTLPLYLEWAPSDVFNKDSEEEVKPTEPEVGTSQLNKQKKRALKLKEKYGDKFNKEAEDDDNEEEVDDEEEDNAAEEEDVKEEVKDEVKEEKEETDAGNGRTLFVKNLNFDTTDEGLKKFFSKGYKVTLAEVSKKEGKKAKSKLLSMGFGFVTFASVEDAEKALRKLQGALLDGHAVELKRSRRTDLIDHSDELKRKEVNNLKQGECTKILVRNIPFQASEKEIKALFTSFGEIKFVRLPRKVASASKHRGFCFVDFVSKLDAKTAFDALVHSTHLYGRRLVLEWAKESETIDEIRERTNKKFNDKPDRGPTTRRQIRGVVEEGMEKASKLD